MGQGARLYAFLRVDTLSGTVSTTREQFPHPPVSNVQIKLQKLRILVQLRKVASAASKAELCESSASQVGLNLQHYNLLPRHKIAPQHEGGNFVPRQ